MRQGRPTASKARTMALPSWSALTAHAHPPSPAARSSFLHSPRGMRWTRGTWIIPSVVRRQRIDEPHGYARDHMLERGTALQRFRARLELNPEVNQEDDQEQRGRIKQF